MEDPLSDPKKFEKMCSGKDKYTSESAATAALHALRKEGLLKRAASLHAYGCDFCGFYHFGH